jgi:hypothetical protein
LVPIHFVVGHRQQIDLIGAFVGILEWVQELGVNVGVIMLFGMVGYSLVFRGDWRNVQETYFYSSLLTWFSRQGF